jgi:hypothetical protein
MEKHSFYKNIHIEESSDDDLFIKLLEKNTNNYHLNNYKLIFNIYKQKPKIILIKEDKDIVFAFPVFSYLGILIITPLYGLIDYSICYFDEKNITNKDHITQCLINYLGKYYFVKTGFLSGIYDSNLNYSTSNGIQITNEISYQMNLLGEIEVDKNENNDNMRQLRRLDRENIIYSISNIYVTEAQELNNIFSQKILSLSKKSLNKLILNLYFFFLAYVYKHLLKNSLIDAKIKKSVFKFNDRIVSEVILREDQNQVIYEMPVYDVKYKKYGIGKLHLIYLMKDYKNLGYLKFDLGVNSEGYKPKYSNKREEYISVKKNPLICHILNYGRIIINSFT